MVTTNRPERRVSVWVVYGLALAGYAALFAGFAGLNTRGEWADWWWVWLLSVSSVGVVVAVGVALWPRVFARVGPWVLREP